LPGQASSRDLQQAFRNAMASVPAGVVVVSARLPTGGYRGLTASSFTSVSLEPPLVLVCLDRFAATRDAVAESGAFNVSALSRSQEFAADRFAGRAPLVDPAWREVPHRLGANGIPIVEGCVAWFECSLEWLQEAGDHEVAIGRVLAAGRGPGEPLLAWDRSFWGLRQ
jgi:flavin reductase (DIM6/NTAB) family NADH-FMN oxidoreductase RutF